jgi:hypothetical protein
MSNEWDEVLSWPLWDGMTPKQACDCLSYVNGDPTIDDILRWADDGGPI